MAKRFVKGMVFSKISLGDCNFCQSLANEKRELLLPGVGSLSPRRGTDFPRILLFLPVHNETVNSLRAGTVVASTSHP